MKNTKKKRIRRSASESQDQILEAALSLVAVHGWSGLSFQMIAKKCRTSTSNVLYHFNDRVTLLRALLDKISKNNFAIVAQGMKPEHNAYERLFVHFDKNLEWASQFPEQAQIVLQIYLEAAHDKEFSKLFNVMVARAQDRIHEYLLAGQRENSFKLKLDSKVTAKFLHNILVGAFINVMGSQLNEAIRYPDSQWNIILKDLTGFQEVQDRLPR